MNPFERVHAGVNQVCKHCKNIFTHHVSEVDHAKEYECEGCQAGAEASAVSIPPAVIGSPIPEEPEQPKSAAVFPDGDEKRMIEHVTADEAVKKNDEIAKK